MTDLIKFEDSNDTTMSSREIAELTGKEHKNVLSDIRNLISQLDGKTDGLNFQLTYYIDGSNRKSPQYELNKEETILLVSGYSAVLRLRIIRRWSQLESEKQQLPEMPKTHSEALRAYANEVEKTEQLALQVSNLETVLDVRLDWVSIIKIAQFNKVSEKVFDWRKLKTKSKELGYEIKRSESVRFDYQNLYHVNVFRACYPKFNYNIKN